MLNYDQRGNYIGGGDNYGDNAIGGDGMGYDTRWLQPDWNQINPAPYQGGNQPKLGNDLLNGGLAGGLGGDAEGQDSDNTDNEGDASPPGSRDNLEAPGYWNNYGQYPYQGYQVPYNDNLNSGVNVPGYGPYNNLIQPYPPYGNEPGSPDMLENGNENQQEFGDYHGLNQNFNDMKPLNSMAQGLTADNSQVDESNEAALPATSDNAAKLADYRDTQYNNYGVGFGQQAGSMLTGSDALSGKASANTAEDGVINMAGDGDDSGKSAVNTPLSEAPTPENYNGLYPRFGQQRAAPLSPYLNVDDRRSENVALNTNQIPDYNSYPPLYGQQQPEQPVVKPGKSDASDDIGSNKSELPTGTREDDTADGVRDPSRDPSSVQRGNYGNYLGQDAFAPKYTGDSYMTGNYPNSNMNFYGYQGVNPSGLVDPNNKPVNSNMFPSPNQDRDSVGTAEGGDGNLLSAQLPNENGNNLLNTNYGGVYNPYDDYFRYNNQQPLFNNQLGGNPNYIGVGASEKNSDALRPDLNDNQRGSLSEASESSVQNDTMVVPTAPKADLQDSRDSLKLIVPDVRPVDKMDKQ